MPIWNRDIDQYCPNGIKSAILQNSLLSKEEVDNLFLSSLNGYLFNDSQSTNAILDLGIFHRKRLKFGMLFCPGCFTKEVKYFRKNWRLSSSIACVDCNLKLCDCCPNCLNPVTFHRLENGYKIVIPEKEMSICSYCFTDLAKTKKIKADEKIIVYQRFINDTLRNGFNDITQYSFTYFEVLHTLERMLYTKSIKWNKVKISVEKKHNVVFKEEGFKRLAEREKSLLACYEILENWPYSFINFINENNFTFTDFVRDKKDKLPSWFTNIIKLTI